MQQITELNDHDYVTIDYFGKPKQVYVFSTGDNTYSDEWDGSLSEEEIACLNWFLNNIKISDYKREISEYCNEVYSMWSDTQITMDDVEDELDIKAIAINITDTWKSIDGELIYPEISFYGWCKCDDEHGICIGFRDKKFLGIDGQDWTL